MDPRKRLIKELEKETHVDRSIIYDFIDYEDATHNKLVNDVKDVKQTSNYWRAQCLDCGRQCRHFEHKILIYNKKSFFSKIKLAFSQAEL